MEFRKEKWMIFRPIVKIVTDYIYIDYSLEEKKKLPDIEKGKD